jgi:HD-GYP domain-containing protein (c-di-GMP phosphodiesterase class II)
VVVLAVAAGGLWLAFYAGWTALRPFGDHGQTVFADTAYLVPIVAATVLAGVAAKRGPSALRGFWALAALSNALWLAGETLWSARELGVGEVPFPWWTDVLYLSSYVPLAAAVFVAFRPTMRTLEPARILDALLAGGSLALAWWVLVLRPVELGLDLGAIVGLAYPLVGGLMLILMTATRVLPARQGSASLTLFALGVLCTALTDGAYTAAAVNHDYVSGEWLSLGWQTEAVLFTVAAAFASARIGHTANWSRFRHAGDVTTAILVTVALGVAFAIAVAGIVRGDGSTDIYAAAVALAVGAIVRIWLALLADRGRGLADIVTGTYDANYHDDQLCRLIARARVFKEPFTLAHIAVDRDGGRHAIDSVVARHISAEGRTVDSASRIGPSRLAVLLPHTGTADGRVTLERMRVAVAHEVLHETGDAVTVSIGAATWEPDDDPDSLAARAESALLAAGHLGGNQVRTATEDRILSAARELGGETFELVDDLTRLADERESATEPTHARAVAGLAREVAVRVGLDDLAVVRTYLAALLHDVGKIAVADAVFAKPGALEPEEWREVVAHADYGARVLARIPALAHVAPLVGAHHERWDGSGYPHGLRGDEIPVEARIIAVADTYVSMLSERPHRSARSKTSALTGVWRESGKLFDPEIVTAFLLVAGEHEFDLPALAQEFEPAFS